MLYSYVIAAARQRTGNGIGSVLGNSFAEALMFTGKPYIINAQALTDTLLLTVRKDAVVGEIADAVDKLIAEQHPA